MKNYNKQDEMYCFILPIIQFKLLNATTMHNSTENAKNLKKSKNLI